MSSDFELEEAESPRRYCKCDSDLWIVILFGGDYTRYKNIFDYKLKFLCRWPVSAYKLIIGIGILSAFALIVTGFIFGSQPLTFLQVVPWSVATIVTLCLLVGTCLEKSSYLVPFRVLCGLVRVLSLLGFGVLLAYVSCFSVYDWIMELSTRQVTSTGHASSSSSSCHPCSKDLPNAVLLSVTCAVLYSVFGFCANAASRCAFFFDQQR